MSTSTSAESSDPVSVRPGIYADQVRIVHKRVNELGGLPTDEFEVVIHPNGPIDVDWIAQEIEAIHIHYDPDTAAYLQAHVYYLEQIRRRRSWGADATTVEFVLQTAASFGKEALIVGATLAVERGWETLIEKLKAVGHAVRYGRVAAPSEARAENEGLWLIAERYPVSVADRVAISPVCASW